MRTYKIPLSPSPEKTLEAEADFFAASEYFPAAPKKNAAILYFHGGGLLCGSRKDLPPVYRDMFLKAGYDFLSLDYPLAPEYTVSQIIKSCLASLRWFLTHYRDELGLDSREYILFGRSAGAYLALQTAFQAIARPEDGTDAFLPPKALLLFYGYPGLTVEDFSKENRYYQSEFPPVSRESAFQAAVNSPDFDTVKSPRALLYIYARQTGRWIDLLGPEEDLEKYSLAPKQLSLLPPSFLTASSTDHDVPFRMSKIAARSIPGAKFYPVYNLEHDFDQDTSIPEGKAAYGECLRWLEETIL